MKKQKGFSLVATIIIIVVTAITTSVSVVIILYNGYKNKLGVTYDTLTKDKALREFLEVYDSLSNEYYKDIDKSKMIHKAIEAMTDYLDDQYTTYMSEQQKSLLEQQLNGEYKGIGVVIKGNVIDRVFKDSPAAKKGVQVGDKIVKVNGESVSDDASTIANLIKKNKDAATIVFERGEKQIELTIELSKLDVPVISYKVIDDNIGYIYMGSFSSTLAKQTKEALEELEKKNIKSLIVDVRDNVGGYLASANDVASLFLEKGQTIYSLSQNDEKVAYKDKTDEKTTYPMVVLINENTASSAEILAAALKESYGATLVGVKSFGKGKVQQTKTLTDGSMVKYTSALWYTPNGTCVDKKGIKPDYKVELDIEYNDNDEIVKVNDTQLEKAKQLLES